MLHVLLMAFAFVCFVVAAFGVKLPRVELGWMGLALWALDILLVVR